jgi:ABC-type glycerol-3-phosphate transport system substrate-binding protein
MKFDPFQRAVAVSSSLVLALSGTLGCGSDVPEEAAPAAPMIRVAYWGGPEEMAVLNELIEQWQQHNPGVQVRLEHTPFSAYVSRLLTRIAGGAAPDIMASEVNLFPRLWAKKVFLPLNDFLEGDPEFDINEFFPEVVKRFTVNGQVYGIPRDTAPFACVYYNKRLFDEAGLPYPTDDWTWNDLLAAAQHLTKRDADGKVTQYGFYAWAWQNFVYSNGGKMVDDLYHPTRCLLDEPAAIEGIQFFADLMGKYEVSPTPMALGNLAMGAQQMFMTGRVAMFSSGYWEVPTLLNIKDFEWDVVMFPQGPTGIRAFATGGTGYSILKSTKHPELAWQVLKALAGREGQRKLAQTGLAQPANQVIAEGPDFAGSDQPPAHKAMLNEAVRYVVYDPFDAYWREVFELYVLPPLDLVFNGQMTAAEAVQAFVPQVNQLLKQAAQSE